MGAGTGLYNLILEEEKKKKKEPEVIHWLPTGSGARLSGNDSIALRTIVR